MEVLKAALAGYDVTKNNSNPARVAISCGTSKLVQDIAKWIAKYAKYMQTEYKVMQAIGDTPESMKKDIFEDADKAFETAAVILFTSTLSVGVDIKKLNFEKLIMITSKLGV